MASARVDPVVTPAPAGLVHPAGPGAEKTALCFQCQKCTNGCPLVFAMDVPPHRVIHSIQLGLVDELLDSDTIWVCASCETCTTRCPNDIDIAHVMDTLRQASARKGVKKSQKAVSQFHAAFLSSIRRFGRVHEASMAVMYALRSGGVKGLAKQAPLGLRMFRKGKIRITPQRLTAGKNVKGMFREVNQRRATATKPEKA